jgi:hypothetical protein
MSDKQTEVTSNHPAKSPFGEVRESLGSEDNFGSKSGNRSDMGLDSNNVQGQLKAPENLLAGARSPAAIG